MKPTALPESGPPAADVVDPLWRRVLNDRFTILEPIGAGGMGKVYRAVQAPLDRAVALKVLNSQYANGLDPEFRRRFFLEASMTAKLRHPNTVTVIDYGETKDGIFFIAMEYLEGTPLSQVLKAGPLPWPRAVNIAQQICRSLREAHRLGIIHRDLKPANVMLLSEEGEQDIVKVLDFGLVKSLERSPGEPEVTHAGVFVGSPLYMSPEQARHQTDTRSDIYSLGVLLYQILVGRTPFVSRSPIELIQKHNQEPPPPLRSIWPELEIPAEVESLLMRCLEKNPAARFQSMDGVLEAMRQANAGSGKSGVFEATPRPLPTIPEAGNSDAAQVTLPIHISVVVPKPPEAGASRASRKKYAIGTVAALVLIATAIMIARSVQTHDLKVFPPPPAPQMVGVPPSPEPAPKTTNPPLPPSVRFRVLSEPLGARVSLAKKFLGVTPLDFIAPAGTDGTATVELSLALKGYHPMTVITGGSGTVVLKQKLQSKQQPKPTDAQADSPTAVAPPPTESRPSVEEPAKAVAAAEPIPVKTKGPPAPAVADPSVKPRLLPRFIADVQRISAPAPHLPDFFTEQHGRGTYQGDYRICVGTDGRVKDVAVVSGLAGADQAIISHLKETWIYRPQAVPFCTEHRFVFKLDSGFARATP